MAGRTGRPSYVLAAERTRPLAVPLLATVALVLVGLLLGGVVGYLAGRPDATTRTVADMRAEEATRDVAQIKNLTEVARQSQGTLTTLLGEVDGALDGSRPASPDQVRAWQATMRTLVEKHRESSSGTTATNVARGGLRNAVAGFATAIDLLAAAQQAPADQRPALLALAKRARTEAATAWSVAATQLDQINVDAKLGHQHVYLQTEPGSGAYTSDGAPEGTGG
ncbi:hypothetical protein AB0J86_37415 [Micromonospora sp. NPDC049559]|uniref:hypothetical protein n=1 Tax=Micromonospora sp. NPDC049559 TaxID=3155923 RepID=UPI003417B290